MDVTASRLAFLAGAGSLVILLAAFGFQHIGELAPCKLCLWQRYPHGVAIFLAVIFSRAKHRLLLWLGGFASLSTAAIAAYHSGVEQKWCRALLTGSAQSSFWRKLWPRQSSAATKLPGAF